MPRLSAAMDRLRRSYCHFAAASFAQQRFLIKAIPFAHDVYKRFHFAYSRAHTYTTSNRCTDQPSKRLLANEEGDLPEIGRFSSRKDGLRPLCWSLSFCAETKPQVNRMRHKAHALFLLARLFNLVKTADYLAGWKLISARAWGLDQAYSNVTPSHPCQVFPSVA